MQECSDKFYDNVRKLIVSKEYLEGESEQVLKNFNNEEYFRKVVDNAMDSLGSVKQNAMYYRFQDELTLQKAGDKVLRSPTYVGQAIRILLFRIRWRLRSSDFEAECCRPIDDYRTTLDPDSIANLYLSVDAYHTFDRLDIKRISTLLEMSDLEIIKLNGVGPVTYKEMKSHFKKHNLHTRCSGIEELVRECGRTVFQMNNATGEVQKVRAELSLDFSKMTNGLLETYVTENADAVVSTVLQYASSNEIFRRDNGISREWKLESFKLFKTEQLHVVISRDSKGTNGTPTASINLF